MVLAPVLRSSTATLHANEGRRPKAGLAYRNTGTGAPKGPPPGPPWKGSLSATRKEKAALEAAARLCFRDANPAACAEVDGGVPDHAQEGKPPVAATPCKSATRRSGLDRSGCQVWTGSRATAAPPRPVRPAPAGFRFFQVPQAAAASARGAGTGLCLLFPHSVCTIHT